MNFLSECTSGGCGAKIGPNELAGFLTKLPKVTDQNLLVGFDSSDDAAVYKISESQALIATMDFFSPMVEDPKRFGKIAAANAMSDVYAMGGEILFALNIVCFPERMDKEVLSEILLGGAEKMQEAGVSLVGGHSIYDHEPKYGLSVTGQVHPEQVIRNDTAQVGDVLILTKALGVGLILSALRGGVGAPEAEKAALDSMERLNKYAAEKMKDYDVHACTDVTGFGLLVHAAEMAGVDKTFVIDTAQLPLLPHAYQYAEEFLATAAGQRNRNAMETQVDLKNISPAFQEILFDPQTSGGLLISVAGKDASALLEKIKEADPAAAIIGEVIEKEADQVIIVL
ncbi:selenide, water dikinase SelD [Enterococcus rivorum]|uniref:Selenide, water dikinase n=1 Tax=Enterococcus rivorum TaxID=762845 RepID=A0A1E5KTM0_9ENTE|nr:selenide, water dikinase SelD [Enterococcus rivorum]MBP2097944.1 selenide,water dikinase [Enterococcus rivorum]OEH81203.1 selenide, water dikinase SelD [Enterococcus rivorum]